jgi:hypothetical protein
VWLTLGIGREGERAILAGFLVPETRAELKEHLTYRGGSGVYARTVEIRTSSRMAPSLLAALQ